ncbi:MAG TPA: helix-turn-helix transcriptional regulator [Intrasporangiaceae bacterium]|nr:helix-turn-helix transcriptional regulator [Intrasporangiaceae bacterium]
MRADARANRAAVLSAARTLFAERGVEVPLRAVATEAGVGIATLYRHFPDRDALILAVAFDVLEDVHAVITRCEEDWDADPEAAWRAFGRGMGRLRLGVIVPALGHRLDVERPPEPLRQARAEAFARVERLIEQAWQAGLVREKVPVIQFNAGLAAVTRPLPEEVRGFVPDLTDWLIDVYLRGLR